MSEVMLLSEYWCEHRLRQAVKMTVIQKKDEAEQKKVSSNTDQSRKQNVGTYRITFFLPKKNVLLTRTSTKTHIHTLQLNPLIHPPAGSCSWSNLKHKIFFSFSSHLMAQTAPPSFTSQNNSHVNSRASNVQRHLLLFFSSCQWVLELQMNKLK